MSPKAIYTDALSWFSKKKTKEQNTSRNDENPNEKSSDFSDISMENELSDADVNSSATVNSKIIKFSIKLSYDVWETIQPVSKPSGGKGRVYSQLEPGLWTSVLVEHIASHRIKNPCTWAFKRSKVFIDGKAYAKMYADCKTCGGHLVGTIPKVPKKGDAVVFLFQVMNFCEDKHTNVNDRKNVRIGGAMAKEIFSSKKPASVIKREMIREKDVQMFEQEKGRTISENAIRAGKSRVRKQNKISSSPLQAIGFLKVSNTFGPMIHMFGDNPFFVIYCSPNQFLLFKTYKRTCGYTKISGDSTGGVVHKLGKIVSLSRKGIV